MANVRIVDRVKELIKYKGALGCNKLTQAFKSLPQSSKLCCSRIPR